MENQIHYTTISHCICLSEIQYICTQKAFHCGVCPKTTGNDTSEDLCKCPSQTPRMLLQLQRCNVIIRYRSGENMLLTDAMSRYPARCSKDIKLDMRVDYIAFNKTWIAKLKEASLEDPILNTVYQLTQQLWPHQ